MKFKASDIPICKTLFSEETHHMAFFVYPKRAREIYEFVTEDFADKNFFRDIGWSYRKLLIGKKTCRFFFESNLVDYRRLGGWNIHFVLTYSPIAKEIWDSEVLDPYLPELDKYRIEYVLRHSPIADKIKASGKIKM